MGLVLLDLGDGECYAMELEGRDGCWHFAQENMGQEFQLYEFGSRLPWTARDVLDISGFVCMAALRAFICARYPWACVH